MDGFPLLSAIVFLPLIGAGLILLTRALVRDGDEVLLMPTALLISGATFLLSLVALAAFDRSVSGYQFIEDVKWFGGIHYKMGIDGMALSLVLLTTFLMPLCFLASWNSVKKQVTSYVIAFLILETLMLGVFCALDLVLFYIFFEGGLIPMFLIIGIWGGANRIYAAFKFFLYTLLGSLLLLIAVVAIYIQTSTADVVTLQNYTFAKDMQIWLWLAFFASFAVKMPMWPVHTWLPDAHVEAPTAGSVILAGVLLKMGGYGFLRFSLPMFPDASVFFQPMVFALSVVAILYASLVAFRQVDIKKLIAYSSVAHMGFVTMGIFALNTQGLQGAVFQMISHGIISGALFLVVGVIYDRMHTREIAFYGGLVTRMPAYAMVFMLFTMANVGLPGTSGFIGEIATMVGVFQVSTWAALGAALGMIISAVYMLTLYRQTVFGNIENDKLKHITDLNAMEVFIFIPLVIGTLALGVFPSLVLSLTEQSVSDILALTHITR